MIYNAIKHILPEFRFEGQYRSVEELTSGNINNTYHLQYAKEGKIIHYTLQHINQFVFKEPDKVMDNILMVTMHLRDDLVREGINPYRHVLELISTRAGGVMHRDAMGDYWRAYRYIDNAVPYDVLEKPRHYYEIGRAFGEFQRRLRTFPAQRLHETIPDFHNTTRRFYAFVAAVAEDRAGRVDALEDEIEFFFERRKMMNEIVRRLKSGELPLRLTHNDTKSNNVLIDQETDEAICVIDLDTVMPGSSLYDFGDAVRFGASTAAEDEEDLSKIGLDMEKYRLFTEGFLRETNGFLTEKEIGLLPLGVKVITCELAMRFLTDYIDGDRYFKVNSPTHNLARAHAQMKLLTDIEVKEEEMYRVLMEIIREGT